MMNYKSLPFPLIAAAVLVGGIILWFLSGLFSTGHTPGEHAPKDTPFQVAVILSKAVPRVRELIIRGHTEANRSVTLRAETTAPVAQVLTEEGQPVIDGQTLVVLELQERLEKLTEAKSLVEQRQLEFEATRKLTSQAFQTKTKLAQSKALLKAAEAELSRIQSSVENTQIKAPFAGILVERFVEVGGYLTAGDKVATVVELNPLKIVAEASEQDISHIKENVQSRVRLATGQELEGKISYVGAVANPETRTFRIELLVPNPDYLFQDGITAEIYIPINTVKAHLVSPAILALDDSGVVGVKSVDKQGIVHFHPVTILSHSQEGVWLNGLPPEITLIATGQDFVITGEKVKPVIWKNPSPQLTSQEGK